MSTTPSMVLACLGFLMWGTTCFAQPSSTSSRLDVSLVGETKDGPANSGEREEHIQDQLAFLDSKLQELESRKGENSSGLSNLEQQCLTIESSIVRLAKDSEKDSDAIKKRLVMLYKFKQMGYAALLIASEDMSTAAVAARNTLSLLQSDYQVFSRFQERNSEEKGLRRALAEKTRELDDLRIQMDACDAAIRSLRQERTNLLQGSRHQGVYAASIEQGESPTDVFHYGALQRKPIVDSPQEHFPGLQGSLPLPTNGEITNTYGLDAGITAQSRLYKNGVLIRARKGQPIQAISDGTVVFADWFKDYGKVMIIDHGEHYYSLVAHADKLLRAVDDRVKGGEAIATVGNTGSRGGAKLYFELRHYGKPVDPMEWLAVRKLSEE